MLGKSNHSSRKKLKIRTVTWSFPKMKPSTRLDMLCTTFIQLLKASPIRMLSRHSAVKLCFSNNHLLCSRCTYSRIQRSVVKCHPIRIAPSWLLILWACVAYGWVLMKQAKRMDACGVCQAVILLVLINILDLGIIKKAMSWRHSWTHLSPLIATIAKERYLLK